MPADQLLFRNYPHKISHLLHILNNKLTVKFLHGLTKSPISQGRKKLTV